MTRRLVLALRLLARRLLLDYPTAAALRRDPGLAEREDTTPEDHAVADVLLAIDRLLDALDE